MQDVRTAGVGSRTLLLFHCPFSIVPCRNCDRASITVSAARSIASNRRFLARLACSGSFYGPSGELTGAREECQTVEPGNAVLSLRPVAVIEHRTHASVWAGHYAFPYFPHFSESVCAILFAGVKLAANSRAWQFGFRRALVAGSYMVLRGVVCQSHVSGVIRCLVNLQ